MPYITRTERARYATALDTLAGNINYHGLTPGQLNYLITTLCNEYLKHNGTNYQHLNDVVGALEGAKLEFYRRTVVPYEDSKLHTNGDV